MSHRIVHGALALVVVLTIGLVAAPSAQAQDDAFALELQVDGTDVRVIISDIDVPVGALDLVLVGLGPLASECVLATGFGLCSEEGGVVRLVAINATGWDATTDLMTVTTTLPPAGAVGLEISRGTDLAGVDLVGAVRSSSDLSTGDGGLGWPIGLAIAAVAVIGIGFAATAARRRGSPSAADSAE